MDLTRSIATRNKVATAATNGAIIIWDLNKVGRKAGKTKEKNGAKRRCCRMNLGAEGVFLLDRVISEHTRAVNRVCFQPENGNVLLSASQDGSMKCWDLRDPKGGARYKFDGKSEAVRDAQFNPILHHEFAAAFETGTIQKWDMRNPKALYDRKVSAHNGPCLTVDWHPAGRLVASGGRDKTIKVWDMSVDSRRPLYTIRTINSVARAQWRPGHDDEITSSALLSDSRIHVWDVRRPHIAKYAFDWHDTTPSSFAWLNSDVLYSCSKDKTFIRQEIDHAYRPINLLRRNGMGWNIQGDLAFAIDKSSRDHFVDETILPKPPTNFMSKKWKKASKLLIEEEAVQYIPPQTCGVAHLPLFDFEAFSVLAEKYEISGLDSCARNSHVSKKKKKKKR